MFKKSFLILCVIALVSPSAFAKTIQAPTCSWEDFCRSYYGYVDANGVVHAGAEAGDTIVLPAGAATWGRVNSYNGNKMWIINPITIKGQGDDTVITMDETGPTYVNGVINLWAVVTVKDLKIIGAATSPVTVFSMEAYTNPATGYQMRGGFRLTNITYEGRSDGYFAYIGNWINSGLIDNCRLSCTLSYGELIFLRGDGDAWQNPSTVGTASNVFIENCTFNNTGYVCDANANSRLVVRFNTMNGTNKVDGHGLASNSPPRGVRSMEIYGNKWTKTGAGIWANIELRGGSGMIFGNSCETGWAFLKDYAYDAEPHGWPNFGVTGTSAAGDPTVITTDKPHNYKTGWPIWVQAPYGNSEGTIYNTFPITVTGPNTFTIPFASTAGGRIDYATAYKTPLDYPIQDQIGNGRDGGPREPAYWFNNTKAGAAWPRNVSAVSASAIRFYRAQMDDPNATFTERDIVRANRDFFADAGFDDATGVSVGTAAQMRAMTPTVAGYGFWVIDEADWNKTKPGPDGQLYVWDGTAWALKYTPYTFPHPMVGGPDAPPAPPTGLKATPIK